MHLLLSTALRGITICESTLQMKKEDMVLLGDLSKVAQLVEGEPRSGRVLHSQGMVNRRDSA